MLTPPLPSNEPERLAALHRLRILDTPAEERFDRITRFARRVFDVPIALVSLVDARRQWFKSSQGLSVRETARDVSFCAHAILGDDVMVVPDARLDPRFCDNPFVTGKPLIRFYAGQPLADAAGNRLGTLCLIDTRPRQLDEVEQQALRDLAAWTESELCVIQSLKQAHALLQEKETRLQAVLDNAAGGIFTLDARGVIESINLAGQQLFGYEPAEVIGRSIKILIPEICASDATAADGRLCTGTREVLGRRRDDVTFPLEIAVSEMVFDEQRRFIAIARDISERKRAEETIQHQAYYDALTNLPNRMLLQERLRQVLSLEPPQHPPLALIVLDLDRLKDINNTLGHSIGDRLLQQVGPRLKSALPGADTVTRLGAGEFALLLPGAAAEQAAFSARQILRALEQPFVLEGLTLDIGVSLGIALYPDHGADPDLLLRRADVALHSARQAGGGYFIYAAEQDPYSPRRLALMGELHQALDQAQLFLLYQPKVNLKTGRVAGVEALVRWQHPQRGVIPPDEFIPLAEQTGLIKRLTLWVLHTALRQCLAWHQAGLEIAVAVNLSARNLQDSQLPAQVAGQLENMGVIPAHLELEITEGTIMADPARAMAILTRLKKMGVRLSIDDFGTGYSSLGYLKKLPVDAIKIDKSFVRDMAGDEDDAAIVRSTVDLAHNLGLEVIAEGVENQETWNRLVALGCDAAQGYYMSRPLPAAELTRWLHESPWGFSGGPEDGRSEAAARAHRRGTKSRTRRAR